MMNLNDEFRKFFIQFILYWANNWLINYFQAKQAVDKQTQRFLKTTYFILFDTWLEIQWTYQGVHCAMSYDFH